MTHDRGALHELTFRRCARGFVLTAYDLRVDAHTTFAFDRIDDLAAWLVEQYRDPPAPIAVPEGYRVIGDKGWLA